MTANIKAFATVSTVDVPTAVAALNILVAAQIAAISALAPGNLTSVQCSGFGITDAYDGLGPGPSGASSAALVLSWVTP
jgi:hypothetical protein